MFIGRGPACEVRRVLLWLGRSSVGIARFGAQDLEEFTDLVLELLGMAHAPSWIDEVAIPPPDTLPLHVSSVHEVADNPLSRPLGDSDSDRNVTKTHVWIALNREKNLCVAREKVPPAVCFRT